MSLLAETSTLLTIGGGDKKRDITVDPPSPTENDRLRVSNMTHYPMNNASGSADLLGGELHITSTSIG